MLINFTDSYEPSIDAGYNLIAKIHTKIANKEAFVGNSKELDKLYAQSLVISGIIDAILNDDNSNPIINETFLHELNYLLTLNIC